MTFLTRQKAAEHLKSVGIPVKGDGLKDHASRGTGPAYTIINGRALYRREDLDAWVAAQAARPVRRRRTDSQVA